MIIPLNGDDLGVYRNENHTVVEWTDLVHRVVFSATRHGNAMSCHFASGKNGIRYIKQAINEFVEFIFNACKWCEIVVAITEKKGVINTIKQCGFFLCASADNGLHLYARGRT